MAREKYSPKGKTIVTKNDIIDALRKIGVNAGDLLFFHSSLSSLGYVEGGVQTVVQAFLEAVGPRGTAAVHTCHFSDWHWRYVQNAPNPAFDVKRSPSLMGEITEFFRQQPGAIRCLDSSNAMCAIGPEASYLAKDSVKCFTPCGKDTAWGKLGELKAHYMFLGVGWSTCTLMHACEEYAYAPYTFMDKPSKLEVVDESGKMHIHVQKVHTPNVPRDYSAIAPIMEEKGLLGHCKIGDAECIIMNAQELIDVGTKCIVENPAFLLKDAAFLKRCRENQRGIIYEQDRNLIDTETKKET